MKIHNYYFFALCFLFTVITSCSNSYKKEIDSSFRKNKDISLLLKKYQGNGSALFYLSEQIKKNEDKILNSTSLQIEALTNSSDAGNLEAMYTLGYSYEYGKLGVTDKTKAFQLYKTAAEKGYASSQTALGVCYLNGIGVEQSIENALPWFIKSSAQNDPYGLYWMAYFLIDGQNMEKDIKKGIDYLIISADKGCVDSQIALANVYYTGNYCEKNYIEAYKWAYIVVTINGYVEAAEVQWNLEEKMNKKDIGKSIKLADTWIKKYNKTN
jgi:TPR repeat protein